MTYAMMLSFGLWMHTFPTECPQEIKTVYVTVRVENIFMRNSSITPPEVDGFVDRCEKHGAKVMLSVVPHRLVEDQNKDGEMARALKRFIKHGHMVIMQSYKQQCSRCGSADHEYNCSADSVALPYSLEARELDEGKHWLEAAIDTSVRAFVSAGTDGQLFPQTVGILKHLGFRWIANNDVLLPEFSDTLSYFPSGMDYTRNLQDSTYARMLEKAKADFARAVASGNFFPLLVRDDFTRRNYNQGIAVKWIDEFLSFVDSFPHIAVRYVTVDDFQSEWFAPKSR